MRPTALKPQTLLDQQLQLHAVARCRRGDIDGSQRDRGVRA